jgi:hypothetical protein
MAAARIDTQHGRVPKNFLPVLRVILMRTFLAALRTKGVEAVHLSVLTANTPARAFYDRLGFAEIDVPDPVPVTYLGRGTTPDL